MKRNLRRGIIGGISFASALFIFQACYGMPQDFEPDLRVEGKVRSKKTGLPVQGIKVTTAIENRYTLTDEEGKFDFYLDFSERFALWFRDIDEGENGQFADRDTLIENPDHHIYLEIELEEN